MLIRFLDYEALVKQFDTGDEHREATTPCDKLHPYPEEGVDSSNLEFSEVDPCCEAVPCSAVY